MKNNWMIRTKQLHDSYEGKWDSVYNLILFLSMLRIRSCVGVNSSYHAYIGRITAGACKDE